MIKLTGLKSVELLFYLLNVLSRASTALCLRQILVKTVPMSLVAPVNQLRLLIMQIKSRDEKLAYFRLLNISARGVKPRLLFQSPSVLLNHPSAPSPLSNHPPSHPHRLSSHPVPPSEGHPNSDINRESRQSMIPESDSWAVGILGEGFFRATPAPNCPWRTGWKRKLMNVTRKGRK